MPEFALLTANQSFDNICPLINLSNNIIELEYERLIFFL